MKRFFRDLKWLVLFVSALASAGFADADQPNIIYINADDLGVMDVGFNSERYLTPNIDQLRAEGMLFTDAYAPAANCAPSRACILSGQYGPRHGVYTVGRSDRGNAKHRKLVPVKNTEHLKLGNLTLATALSRGGYKTIHLGKWHVGSDPLQQGFDVNIGGDQSGSPNGGYFAPFKAGSMKQYNDLYPKGAHRVDVFSDQAKRFMRENKTEPFLVHMAFYSVHSRIEAVPELVAKYEGRDVHAAYASMVEKMDQGIGEILDELETLGLKEKTLVVFCSDNGGVTQYSKQAPYRAGKGSYFEGGVRVPLVVRWPGKIAPNSSCNIPVIGMDFYPTFLEAAGVSAPKDKVLDGKSLMPLFLQQDTFPKRTLFWHFPVYLQATGPAGYDFHDRLFRTRPGSALRQGKWKFHEYFEDGRVELYDLSSDLGELNNIADSNPAKAAELHQVLKQWRTEVNAPECSKLNARYSAAEERTAIKKRKMK